MFAWNDHIPKGVDDIMYHQTKRGSLGVAFFEDGKAGNEISSAMSVNFTVDGVSLATYTNSYKHIYMYSFLFGLGKPIAT